MLALIHSGADLFIQQMPHLGCLGIEIMFVFRVTPDDERHALDDIDPRLGQNFDFLRVVGQQANLLYAEQFEHVGTERKVALIGGKAELVVGFDGIVALIL